VQQDDRVGFKLSFDPAYNLVGIGEFGIQTSGGPANHSQAKLSGDAKGTRVGQADRWTEAFRSLAGRLSNGCLSAGQLIAQAGHCENIRGIAVRVGVVLD